MYEPFTTGKRFRIVPPDTEPINDRVDIIMARGAFGSGEHETTASCIKVMESLDLGGKTFLDLGSGTGILGIAALKLGACNGICVDVEVDAVESARHNCELNGIHREIDHRCGTLDIISEQNFDLVLANIYGDILLDICDDLTHKVRPGGTILLSGILWEYNFDIRQKYERNKCSVMKNQLLEEFSTVLLKKNK